MKSKLLPVRYTLLTSRMDQLWLPATFWALFVLLAVVFWEKEKLPNLTGSFLGGLLPLLGGVMSAYAVLDDPALELHFAAPRPAWSTLLERLGLILAAMALTALAYQGVIALLGANLSGLGNPAVRQLAWLVPTIALIALGSALAFAMASSAAGSMVVGLVWIVQVLLRSWFGQDELARYFFLFLGISAPGHPALVLNQACLFGLAALLLLASWSLLKKQERYL